MKNGGKAVKVCSEQVRSSGQAGSFPSVFMWFEVLSGSDAVSDPLFGAFHPGGNQTHPPKDATLEEADWEALKWF